MPLLGSVGGITLGFLAYDWTGQFEPKIAGFLQALWGSYLIQQGKNQRDGGDCWSQVLLGESYQELTFACDSVGCYLGHVLTSGSLCQFKAPQTAWPNKVDAEAIIPWNSLNSWNICFCPCIKVRNEPKPPPSPPWQDSPSGISFPFCGIIEFWLQEKPAVHLPKNIYVKG